MTEEQFTLRLVEAPFPSGEIDFVALTRIARALHNLSVRVGRWQANTLHTGRSPELIENLTRLRLTGLREGSTVLQIARGSGDYLDLDDDLSHDIEESFWGMIAAIGADAPPEGTPPLVREAALDVIDALQSVCEAAEFVSSNRDSHSTRFAVRSVHREVWEQASAGVTTRMHGVLEMIDLKTAHFRLRDQAGNAIALERVAEATEAARWVGRAVIATGMSKGRRSSVALEDVLIEPADNIEIEWSGPGLLDAELAKPGPSLELTVDLDDEEWTAFIEAAQA